MRGVEIFQKIAVALLAGAKLCAANNLVDWGDWEGELQKKHNAATTSSSGKSIDETVSATLTYRGKLQDLVDMCARRLGLREFTCDKRGNHRVPLMECGDLPCGFQTRMTHRTLENLASRYTFHFVGDSTTRRLAESFVSIATDKASGHEYYHERRNLTIGELQVKFYWAPFCEASGHEPGVGVGLEEVLDDQEQKNRLTGGRRAVIITAFGVWDAVHGTGDEASLNACSDVVTKLTNVAQLHTTVQETAVNTDASPPMVFLLQNNPFLADSEEDHFLSDLHQIQRQIVENSEEGELYIVRDRDSIYERMSCFRMGESIHFMDPVKLVEGKMLWDLIALVAGVAL